MSEIQKQQPNTLQQFLALRQKHLQDVLPRSSALTPDKLIKLTILATTKTPELAKCSMASIFQCLLQCAELGLDPSGTTGQAYLIPFKGTCTLVIGYKGLIDLARRGGTLRQIETRLVYERDHFKLRFGLDPLLEHEPCLDGDPGAPRLVYCVAQLADGAKHVEVMTVAEVNKIRDRSRSGKNGPWVTDWSEMARKTVARRACKWLPMSPEAASALARDEEDIIDGQATTGAAVLGDVSAPAALPAQTQTDSVKAKLQARRKPVVVDVAPGESEEQALARVQSEPERHPISGEIIPDGVGEPPPPGDDDAPFGLAGGAA